MNLRQQSSSETTPRETPWYQTPEIAVAAPEPQTQYEPEHAERIFARAGALQELQGKLLSREQIEATAAEVGIRPEFVQLAMEQEKAGQVLSPQVGQTAKPFTGRRADGIIAAFIVAYGVFSWKICLLQREIYTPNVDWIITLLLPAQLAVLLGAVGRSRRVGAVSGAGLAMATIVAGTIATWHNDYHFDPDDIYFCIGFVSTEAWLGVVGAEGRRIASRHWAAKRKRGNPKP